VSFSASLARCRALSAPFGVVTFTNWHASFRAVLTQSDFRMILVI